MLTNYFRKIKKNLFLSNFSLFNLPNHIDLLRIQK